MPKLTPALVARKMRASGLVKSATLIKVTPGVRSVGNLINGTNPTTVSYAASGWVTTTNKKKIGGTLVEETDRVVALLGSSIASAQIPTTNDRLTIDGKTQNVVGVDRDPGKAIYVCLCRG